MLQNGAEEEEGRFSESRSVARPHCYKQRCDGLEHFCGPPLQVKVVGGEGPPEHLWIQPHQRRCCDRWQALKVQQEMPPLDPILTQTRATTRSKAENTGSVSRCCWLALLILFCAYTTSI